MIIKGHTAVPREIKQASGPQSGTAEGRKSIQMADVKKGKPKKAASRSNGIVYATQEDLYERALREMNTDSLIVQYQYKAETYLKAAAMFDEVGDYLDAPQKAALCREKAAQAGIEEKEDRLKKAVRLRDKGSEIHDLEKAAAQLKELGDFGEAGKEYEVSRQKLKKALGIRKRKQITVLAVLVLLLAGITVSVVTNFYRYVLAFGYEKMGLTEKSQHIYADLGDLLDSREKAVLLKEQLDLEQDAEDFRELKKAKTGTKVTFAKVKWRILERDDDIVRLILETVERGDPCFERYYQEPGAPSGNAGTAGLLPEDPADHSVTWDSCTLHEWLSSNELMRMFEPKEAAALLPDENGDYFTILTAKEAEEYSSILPKLSSRVFWLQDLAENDQSESADRQEKVKAQFVIPGGAVMSEGYPVTEGTFSVRPVIRVDLDTLQKSLINNVKTSEEADPGTAAQAALQAWEAANEHRDEQTADEREEEAAAETEAAS